MLPHLRSGWAVDQAILNEVRSSECCVCGQSTRLNVLCIRPYARTHIRSSSFTTQENKVVVIRFGHDENETCMQMDEILYKISEDVRNFAVVYLVDISEVRACLG